MYTVQGAHGDGEAERLRAMGQPAVPVFWIAAEDDDFDEVRSAWLLDRGDALQEARLTADWQPQQSVGDCPIPPESFDEVVAQLWSWLPENEFTASVMERAWLLLGPRRPVGQGFGRWLTDLLGRFGLLVVDPTTPALRRWPRRCCAACWTTPRPDPAGERSRATARSPGLRAATHRPRACVRVYLLDADGVRQRLGRTVRVC